MNREENIGLRVRHITNLIRRSIDRGTDNCDKIQHLHGWAVSYLFDNRDKKIFQKDFEKQFSIRRSTASNILKSMENNGLIKRISCPHDARMKQIVLTERAINTHKKIIALTEEREMRLRKYLTEEEITQFFKITDKIIESLEDQNA